MTQDYPFLNLADVLTTTASTDTTSISSSNIVSSSLFISEGLDACQVPAHLNSWSCSDYTPPPPNAIYSSLPHLHLPTPDSSPQIFPCYPPCEPVTSAPAQQLHVHASLPPVADLFFRGSSLEESPISSPGDLERDIYTCTTAAVTARDQQHRRAFTTSPRPPFGIGPNLDSCSSSEDDTMNCHSDCSSKLVPEGIKIAPDGIKMPQRKGGMQLWQFLYSMLNDKEGKYRNLIEWTDGAKERQFRLLEPDAIAVWWGHHKNKPNMSYDKLSRSLRYYYDKGIIRKISGERFVYRFCIDPEVMYKHMGTSNARPQLKPMPQDAKVAMNKDHNITTASPCVAVEPECLPLSVGNTVEHVSTSYPLLFTPPTADYTNSLSIPSTSSFTTPPVGSNMRRCHSYDSTCRATYSSPLQTPSASSFDGFTTLYSSPAPTNFSSTPSPNTSPPQSATLQNHQAFATLPSQFPQQALPWPTNDYYFPPPPLIPVPPYTTSY